MQCRKYHTKKAKNYGKNFGSLLLEPAHCATAQRLDARGQTQKDSGSEPGKVKHPTEYSQGIPTADN